MASFIDKLKKGMQVEEIISSDEGEVEEEVKEETEKTREKAEEKNLKEKNKKEKEKEKKDNPKITKTKIGQKRKSNRKEEGKTTMKRRSNRKEEEGKQKIAVNNESSDKENNQKMFEENSLDKEKGELAIDLYQTDRDIVIQAAIAGINPEDLDISIENDMIIIEGERRKPIIDNNEKDYFFEECYWGKFSREIILPEEIDISSIQASLKNGILTIRMTKSQKNKKKKIIIE